ncbi:MAG: F0F1 ATP synthase subunit B [Candidatus Andersenbacteria bacterium]
MSLFITVAQAATEAHQATESAGIGAIGLDARALLWQIVNFAILLFLLKRFAYKPIVNVLEARRQRIEESLKSAQTIEATRAALESEKRTVLSQAQQQAEEVVARGKQHAKEIVALADVTATQKAAQLVTQAEAKIEQEVLTAQQGLKHEAAQLVALATEKIIDEKLDAKKDAALIERALKEVSA